MIRDMDLVREILLRVEIQQDPSSDDLLKQRVNDADRATVSEHLRLLIDEAKLITGMAVSDMDGEEAWIDLKLTWAGHDFLDAVRDPKVWARTKRGAEHVKGFTFDLLKDLAKGLLKKQIEEHTGVKL
jgi:uncharacterized protein DUF2513